MNKRKQIVLLFFAIVVFSTQFFRFVYWEQLTRGFNQYYYVLYPLIVIFAIPYIKPLYHGSFYAKEIIAVGLVPYLCIITIMIKGSGFSFQYDLPPILFSMAIFSYFLLAHYNVSDKIIINSVLAVGLIVFFIQVIQQLNPTQAIFGIIDKEEAYIYGDVATIRNDMYRFLLPTQQFSLFCLFYSWTRLLKKRSIQNLLIFTSFAISVYLYLSRQIIFSAIIVLSLTTFLAHRTKKRFSSSLPIIFALVILAFSTAILGGLIDKTMKGGESIENRLMAYPFFINKIKENFLTFLFGCGTPKESILWHEMGLNASDIGFVGEVFHRGILSLLIYLTILYKTLLKYGRETPLFIRLYLICTFINSIMIFPYLLGHNYFLWAILLYLADTKVSRSTTDRIAQTRVIYKQLNHKFKIIKPEKGANE